MPQAGTSRIARHLSVPTISFEKEQDVLAESRAKDQHIIALGKKLRANEVKMSSLSRQIEQQQRRLAEMLQQRSKLNIVHDCSIYWREHRDRNLMTCMR